jgi:hypothetical protein
MAPAPSSKGNRYRHCRFRLRDGSILLRHGVIPAADSAGRLSSPVGGRGQLTRDSGTDCSYPLNINSQNIVRPAAARRGVTTTDVQKMTHARRGDRPFSPKCGRHELPTRVFNGGGTGLGAPHALNFCRHNCPDRAPGRRRGGSASTPSTPGSSTRRFGRSYRYRPGAMRRSTRTRLPKPEYRSAGLGMRRTSRTAFCSSPLTRPAT